jgi:hypothetical protein
LLPDRFKKIYVLSYIFLPIHDVDAALWDGLQAPTAQVVNSRLIGRIKLWRSNAAQVVMIQNFIAN